VQKPSLNQIELQPSTAQRHNGYKNYVYIEQLNLTKRKHRLDTFYAIRPENGLGLSTVPTACTGQNKEGTTIRNK